MRLRRRLALVKCVCLGIFVAASVSPAEAGQDRERSELLEILKQAKPAPAPSGPEYSPEESAAAEQRRSVIYDPATGEETFLPASPDRAGETRLAAPPQEGLVPRPSDGSPVDGVPVPPEGREGEAGSGRITATPPSPLANTYSHPWNTVYKLLMRFSVSGQDYFYVCSAASTGSFHLLTAGHCIYNWDPNDDGNTSDATWASEIWVWAAQTDLVNPVAQPDYPYGEAKAVFLRSYTGWTVNQNFDHDWGVITLDRRMGDHTGWMGREANVTTTSLNFDGYPVEAPYVPADTWFQYPGFDTNNVIGYTAGRIRMDAFVYGGHSGGPAWRFSSAVNERWIQGMNSTSDRVGYAEETLLTGGKFADLNTYMSADESSLAPTPRPDLIEYVFNGTSKDLLTNSAAPGGTIQVKYNVLNGGFAGSGTVAADFYLSTNSIISTSDTLIGTRTLASLGPFTFTVATTTLTLPSNLAAGTYFVGWIMTGTVVEYPTDFCNGTPCNNIAVIANEAVTVNSPCFTLTRAHTGSGSDPVASPPNSSGCPAGQYQAGQSISLTASPAGGWSVGSWSGTNNNGSTSTSNSATMPAGSHTVTVNYVSVPPPCFLLTRTHTGSGSNPSASPGSSAGCAVGQYHAGESISLTASPASGWSVAGWSGTSNDASMSTANSLVMPGGAHTVSVQYQNVAMVGASFFTVTPCRVLDTRTGGGGPLHSHTFYFVQIAGFCGIPFSAEAVSLNLTVVSPTGSGHLTFWPADLAQPLVSSINFSSGQVRANDAILRLATDGLGDVAVEPFVSGNGTVHVIVDANGYFQ